jgi:NAD(P)-dependent dehydrogenase (short-subunit alcohol dehydrogenase family)
LRVTAALGDRIETISADLRLARSAPRISAFVEEAFGGLDILVHSAGIRYLGRTETAPVKHFDQQYLSNVRGPYALTQALLPMLKRSRGQVVFINSTAGLNAKRADAAQYCATQHAVKAMADSLREEVNPDGVRVLTVHPGRTATPRQEKLYRAEGRPYRPELLVQPEDVASVVLHSLLLPRRAEITDVTIRPTVKP